MRDQQRLQVVEALIVEAGRRPRGDDSRVQRPHHGGGSGDQRQAPEKHTAECMAAASSRPVLLRPRCGELRRGG